MGFIMRIKLTEILQDGTLKNYYENGTKAGYQFNTRLAYYRGQYLSVIDELKVSVDGTEAAEEDLRFCINGKEFAVWELKEAFYEFWRITDDATIKVRKLGGLKEGAHDVKLTLMFRCPYLPIPGAEHGYAPVDGCDQKQMVLTETAY